MSHDSLPDMLRAGADPVGALLANPKAKRAITLSPAQVACGVSPSLVYLAGLALGPGRKSNQPPFTAEEENTFSRLQIVYHQATRSTEGLNILRLSPMLVPHVRASEVATKAAAPSVSEGAMQAAQGDTDCKLTMP